MNLFGCRVVARLVAFSWHVAQLNCLECPRNRKDKYRKTFETKSDTDRRAGKVDNRQKTA